MADILNKIIGLMTKEEQRNFKLFALRSHEDPDRKDIQLFDLIRKEGDRFEDRSAVKQLYGKNARPNTYHRLRNRLLQELGKSMSLLHWEKDETICAVHELTLAMLFRRKMQFEIAEYYLHKAEKKVAKLDLPELLDIVLGEFISLSLEVTWIDPAIYIKKRTENRRRLNQLWEIDNVLATMNHRLRRSQNLGKGDASVMNILRKTVEEFSIDAIIMADPKFRFRVYDAVSKILLEQRDYLALEAYMIETYDALLQEGLFNKGNHDVKLQMLTYIINALFKNGKIDASLAYAERLRIAMDQYGHMLQSKYELFYYNSLFLNYSGKDQAEAIKVLEKMQAIDSIAAMPQYLIFIYLNLGLMEYTLKHYKAAIKHVVKLRMHESLTAADDGFRLRIDIFELALRLELRDNETLDYRLQQVKHDYAALLESHAMEKDSEMLMLIGRLNQKQWTGTDEGLSTAITEFLERYPADDTELFTYGEFLRGKI
ncbi:MAG: hypothetical protein IPP17_12300 [Bacteroidetes bacterium]|nr:hypothetical protein [Bacteroidota bacterium]